MNCTEVNEKLVDLFDTHPDQQLKDELFAHFRDCSDCRTLYEEMSKVMSELKPEATISASEKMHSTVMEEVQKVNQQERHSRIRMMHVLTPTWKKVAAIAAILIIVFILFPVLNHSGSSSAEAKEAKVLLGKSMRALENIKSVYMVFNVRTLSGDNFEYIDLHSDFVEHKIWKTYDTVKWRLRETRKSCGDGWKKPVHVYGKNTSGFESGS